MSITYEQMVIWHNLSNIHIHQNLFEFCGWLNILDEIQPKTGLEIGTYFFGTSQMCLEAIPTIQTLITVDIEDRWKDKEKDLLKYGNRLKFIMGNSQNQEIIDTIVKLSPFDFLFIDGDHSYDCVVNDFRKYGAMVRKGGVIGMHDVNVHPLLAEASLEIFGSVHFWEEIIKEFPGAFKIPADPGPWGNYGIGVIRV